LFVSIAMLYIVTLLKIRLSTKVTKEHEEKTFVDIFIRTLVNTSSWEIPLNM